MPDFECRIKKVQAIKGFDTRAVSGTGRRAARNNYAAGKGTIQSLT